MKVVTLKPLNDRVVVRTESNVLETLLSRNCELRRSGHLRHLSRLRA